MSQKQKTIKPAAKKALARASARLKAVQALYQMELGSEDAGEVMAQFAGQGLANEPGQENIVSPDWLFFESLIKGIVKDQRQLDPVINDSLAKGWTLSRLDATVRAILRAGCFELTDRRDVPARVIINEYVEIAHSFFDGEESRLINGVLDTLARDLRAGEF
jgi:transcription antitermination protein NusB